jgi:hypothetical protein
MYCAESWLGLISPWAILSLSNAVAAEVHHLTIVWDGQKNNEKSRQTGSTFEWITAPGFGVNCPSPLWYDFADVQFALQL